MQQVQVIVTMITNEVQLGEKNVISYKLSNRALVKHAD